MFEAPIVLGFRAYSAYTDCVGGEVSKFWVSFERMLCELFVLLFLQYGDTAWVLSRLARG